MQMIKWANGSCAFPTRRRIKVAQFKERSTGLASSQITFPHLFHFDGTIRNYEFFTGIISTWQTINITLIIPSRRGPRGIDERDTGGGLQSLHRKGKKKLSLPLKELTPRSKAKMLRIQHTPGFGSLTASRLLFSAIFDIENTQHTKTDIKQQVGTWIVGWQLTCVCMFCFETKIYTAFR